MRRPLLIALARKHPSLRLSTFDFRLSTFGFRLGTASASVARFSIARKLGCASGKGLWVARFDGKLESWEAGTVKVTLELPSDLVREMKMQAVQEGRKLKDVAEQIFRRGLAAPAPSPKTVHRRVKLPLIECRHEATPTNEMTPERVADLLLRQEVEALDEAARC